MNDEQVDAALYIADGLGEVRMQLLVLGLLTERMT